MSKYTKIPNSSDLNETKEHTGPNNNSLHIIIKNEESNLQTSQKKQKSKEQQHRYKFQIFHKKEIIPNNPKKSQNYIKCIYCGSQYYNIHRFEAHIRVHASIYILTKI